MGALVVSQATQDHDRRDYPSYPLNRYTSLIKHSYPWLALVVIAVLLRFLGIFQRPLWYDEAFAVLFSEKGPVAMTYGTLAASGGGAADVHPLGYYTLLWAWMGVFGESQFAVRLLSVIAGLGAVVIAYVFMRRLFGGRLAFYLAGLAAISPFQVHYSQEVRMYALLAFFLIICTWALWEGMRTRRGWGWWLVFSLTAALAQYCHYLAFFYLLPLTLTPVLSRNWKALRRLIIASIGAVILYLPWLVHLPAQFARVQSSYWTAAPGVDRLVTTLMSFVVNLPLPPAWLPLGLFITCLVFVLGCWQTFKSIRRRENNWQAGIWLAYLGLAPVILLFLFSQWKAVYIERALLASGLVFLLWLGWALFGSHLPRFLEVLMAGLLITGAGMGIYQHLTYQGFPYAPFQVLDASLSTRVASQDVILHSNKLSLLPCLYYDRRLPQRFMADPAGSGSDTLAPSTQEVLGIQAYENMEQATANAGRIWFVIYDKALQEYESQGGATQPHLAWLMAYYQLENVETWGDLRLYVFVEP